MYCFEGHFYTYLCGSVGRGDIKVFFSYILFSFKKGLQGIPSNIWNKYNFFLLTVTSGWFLLVQHYVNCI